MHCVPSDTELVDLNIRHAAVGALVYDSAKQSGIECCTPFTASSRAVFAAGNTTIEGQPPK